MTEVIVVRAPNWLGDTVMALPALASLRTWRPQARIVVLGPWARLLAAQGVADLLIPYPPATAEARRKADRALRAERPVLAALLPNSFASAVSAWRWRARRRIGFATDARTVLLTDAVELPDPRRHQVDEYLFLAAAAGAPGIAAWPRWKLPADPDADAEVESLLEALGIDAAGRRGGGAPLVGLHVGASGGAAKRWMPERFGELASELRRAGVVPLLLGASGDRLAAERAAAAGGPVASAVGRDRVELLPHLLAHLSCLISGDTGVAHLAAALGVPTVTLFGPTDPRRTAPRGPHVRILGGVAPCAPCFLAVCPIEHICLSAVEPAAVAGQVLEALA